MCGVGGYIPHNGDRDFSILDRMVKALAHRGPDDHSIFCDQKVGIAHTRLAINGIETGHQPFMHDGVVLFVNGEIYNHQSLRDQMGDYPFRSRSDCEIILPLYLKYGMDFVHHIQGMFAIAIYDQRIGKLFLVRDRLGEKPIIFYQDDNGFLFASEFQTLLGAIEKDLTLDKRQIGDFFRYQFIPEPNTIFAEIKKIPAGHYLEVDIKSGNCRLIEFWNMLVNSRAAGDDPARFIKQALTDSVSACLMADTPIAISLSSGVDSSAIAAIAAQHKARSDIHVITVGYGKDDTFDESSQAHDFAAALGLQEHSVVIDDDEASARFPEVVLAKDEPIADISGFSYLKIMECARKNGLPVILQGHGSDELFWGYPWVNNSLSRLSKHADMRQLFAIHPDETAERPAHGFVLYEEAPYLRWAISNAHHVFTQEFLEASGYLSLNSRDRYGAHSHRADLEYTKLMCDYFLKSVGVAQGDRLSMSCSVEMRLPFLDQRLVEGVIGLRKTSPDYALGEKFWLRKALKDILPAAILQRPKRGFGSPAARWLTNIQRDWGGVLRDGLLVSEKIIKPEMVKHLLDNRLTAAPELTLFRQAITLELWLRQYS